MALQFQTNNFKLNLKRCRVCLNERGEMISLYDSKEIEKNLIVIADILVMCCNIELSADDNKPQYICSKCTEAAKISYEFRTTCEQSEIKLNEELMNAVPKITDEEDTIKLKEVEASNAIPDIQPQNSDNEEFDIHSIEARTCDLCDKIFCYRGSMLKHRKKHNAPPKKCEFCEYVPEKPSDLSKHNMREHPDKKTVICKICGKDFFKKNNLRMHMILHTGEKRHVCEICGVSFALSGNLTVHKRIHSGEKPYKCPFCEKTFAQYASLCTHLPGHSENREYVCSTCGARFSRLGSLKSHEKRHTNLKPFKCNMCGRAFAFSSERKRHMFTHTGIRNFKCEICGKRFSRNANLKVHIRIHTGETPHVCEICGKGFIQAHCLRSHLNTHKKSELTEVRKSELS